MPAVRIAKVLDVNKHIGTRLVMGAIDRREAPRTSPRLFQYQGTFV
jgi:hypothetical protein